MAIAEEQKLCIQCRKCCHDVQIDTGYENDDREAAEFYGMRGFKVVRGDDGYLSVEMAFPCPQLGPEGCKIYPKRPKVCREYTGAADYGKDCLLTGLKKKPRNRS